MTNSDLRSAGGTGGRGSVGWSSSADSIASDFAALAALFERQLDSLSPSDTETRAHLVRAKKAAERGAELCRQLLEQLQASK